MKYHWSIWLSICGLVLISNHLVFANKLERGSRSHGNRTVCGASTTGCFCRGKNRRRQVLTCTKSNCLNEFPTEVIPLTDARQFQTIVILRQKKLTEVKETDFANLLNLRNIRLASNNISTVHMNAFKHLSALKLLDLRKNALAEIPEAIRGITSLEKLNLGRNQISHIDNSILGSLRNLKYLVLSRNKIKQFPALLSKKLLKISLNRNQIEEVPDLRYLTSLRTVYLRSNRLKQFPNRILPGSVRSVSVCDNNIGGSLAISDLTKLVFLDVSNNQPGFDVLGRSAFSDKHSKIYGSLVLRWLVMKNSGINHIEDQAFRCLGKLRYLDISHNNLTQYQMDWFIGNAKLDNIEIADNDWTCSCLFKTHLLKVKEHYSKRLARVSSKRKNPSNFTNDFDKIMCTTPQKDKVLINNYEPETTCKTKFQVKKFNPCTHQRPKLWLIQTSEPNDKDRTPVTPELRYVTETTKDESDDQEGMSETTSLLEQSHTTQDGKGSTHESTETTHGGNVVSTQINTVMATPRTTVQPTNYIIKQEDITTFEKQKELSTLHVTTDDNNVAKNTTRSSLSTTTQPQLLFDEIMKAVENVTIIPQTTTAAVTTTVKQTTASTTMEEVITTTQQTTTTQPTTPMTTARPTPQATTTLKTPQTTTTLKTPQTTTTLKTTQTTTPMTTTTPQHTTTLKTTQTTTTTPQATTTTSSTAAAAPEVSKRCMTNTDRTCVFPFIHNGAEVNECVGGWVNKWCSLTYDYDTDGEYDYCEDLCR